MSGPHDSDDEDDDDDEEHSGMMSDPRSDDYATSGQMISQAISKRQRITAGKEERQKHIEIQKAEEKTGLGAEDSEMRKLYEIRDLKKREGMLQHLEFDEEMFNRKKTERDGIVELQNRIDQNIRDIFSVQKRILNSIDLKAKLEWYVWSSDPDVEKLLDKIYRKKYGYTAKSVKTWPKNSLKSEIEVLGRIISDAKNRENELFSEKSKNEELAKGTSVSIPINISQIVTTGKFEKRKRIKKLEAWGGPGMLSEKDEEDRVRELELRKRISEYARDAEDAEQRPKLSARVAPRKNTRKMDEDEYNPLG